MVRRHLVIVVAASSLVLVGCGEVPTAQGEADSAAHSELPGDFQVQGAAAFGSDLVVVGSAGRPGRISNQVFLRRDAAGGLMELPKPPTSGVFRIASAGPSVIAGGISCGDQLTCDQGPAVLYRLSEDGDKWTELYRSSGVLPFDVEVTAARGVRDYGWVQIDGNLLLVDSGGELVIAPEGADRKELPILEAPGVGYGTPSFFCDLGDRQLVVPAGMGPVDGVSGVEALGTVNGAVWELQYGRLEAGWIRIADAPSKLSNLGAVAECGGSTLIIHAEDGEHVFDSESLSWSIRPESFEQLHGSPVFSLQQPGSLAVAPDNRTVFAVTGGRVIVRPKGGAWVDSGHYASEVYSTRAGVVAIDARGSDTKFTELRWE